MSHLSQASWDKARDAFVGRCFLGDDAFRDELMAHQYLLYKEKKEIRKMRQEPDRCKERADESSHQRVELSSTGNTIVGAEAGLGAAGAGNRNQRSSSWLNGISEGNQREMSRNLDVSFMTVDSRGNMHPKTPQAAIVTCKTYRMTTQPAPGDPRAQVHRTLIGV
jgi:hypothetical protein